MRNGIKRDLGLFVQDRWAMGRITLNLGLRYDQFIGETRESEVLPNRFVFTDLANGVSYGECPDGKAGRGCYGEVQNWKDISPRVGFAMDVFGNGRTALKASFARYVAGQNVAVAREVNPVEGLTSTDARAWTDRDGNRLPLDADGAFNRRTRTLGVNAHLRTERHDDVVRSWGPQRLAQARLQPRILVAAQHQLADRVSVNGGYFRREFGNQTFTDDLRYDANSYNYFCMNAPADPDLPGGGAYQICGIPDLKPEVFALNQPANSLIRFSDDFGGETNMYQGFDVNLEGRFRNGAFLKGGIAATSRTFDNCNLLQAGPEGASVLATAAGPETYSDGSSYCHREYPYRPDVKLSGLYPLPWGIQLAGTYQFSRGRSDRRRRSEHSGQLYRSATRWSTRSSARTGLPWGHGPSR